MDYPVLAMRLGYVNLWEFYADWDRLTPAEQTELVEAEK